MPHIEELKAKVVELQATIEAMENEATNPKKFEWKHPVNATYLMKTIKDSR